DLALANLQVGVIDGGESAEPHDDALGLQDRVAELRGGRRGGVGGGGHAVTSSSSRGVSSIRAASCSSSSWNSSLRRWLAMMPSGRNRIMITSSSPKISSR